MNLLISFFKAYRTLRKALLSTSGALAAVILSLAITTTAAQAANTIDWSTDQYFDSDRTFDDDIRLSSQNIVITVATGVTVTINGNLTQSGNRRMTKDGWGKLVLNGTNSYTGATWIKLGTVEVSKDVNSCSMINLESTSSLIVFKNSSSVIFEKEIEGPGELHVRGTGRLTLTDDNTSFTGWTTVFAGARLVLGNETKNGLVGNIVNNGLVVFNHSSNKTYSGEISGSGYVQKYYGTKLTFNGVNRYTGVTEIWDGTLALGANGKIEESSCVVFCYGDGTGKGVKLDISSGDKTVNGIRTLKDDYTMAEIVLGGSALTLMQKESSTFAGIISGTATDKAVLIKKQTGTLKLTGTSTYKGNTEISNGGIEFSGSANLGTGNIVFTGGKLIWANDNLDDISGRIYLIEGGATFEVNKGIVQFHSSFPVITSTGTVTKTGAGQLNYFKDSRYLGETNVNAGCLDIAGTEGGIRSTKINVAAGAILACSRSTDYSYPGNITGAGKLVNSNGLLTLTGVNTFSGGLEAKGSVSIGNGGTVGSILSDCSISVDESKEIIFNHDSSWDTPHSGIITGKGGVTHKKGGTLTLSGANTYTGTTTIVSGTLKLAGTIASSVDITGENGTFLIDAPKTITGLSSSLNSSKVILNADLTIDRSSGDQSFAGVISGSGGLIKSGVTANGTTCTLMLGGKNTYTGATTVKAGTLVLASSGSIEKSKEVNLGSETYGLRVPIPGVGLSYTFGKLDISAANKMLQSLNATVVRLKGSSVSSSAEVLLGNKTLYLGTAAGSNDGGGDFAGKFSGTNGNVTKTGTATFTMSGKNTATGIFTQESGRVKLSGSTWAGNYTQSTTGTQLEITGAATVGGTLNLNVGHLYFDLTTTTTSKLTATGAANVTGMQTLHVTTGAVSDAVLIEASSGLGNSANFSADMPGMSPTLTCSATQVKLSAIVTDNTAPSIGSALAAGATTDSSVELTWGGAQDDQTANANLIYTIYCSESNNIGTIAQCEADYSLEVNSVTGVTAYTVTGLDPNTLYYFNVVVKDQPGNKAIYSTVSKTTEKAALTGLVTITGNAVFGETLTADVSALASSVELGTVTYQWKRGSTNIGTNAATYTIGQADVGQTISVTVSTANTQGEVIASLLSTVAKATQAAPSVPSVKTVTHNSITLVAISGAEYMINSVGTWQDSPIFTGLNPETDYSFQARMKGTETHEASQASGYGALVTTLTELAIENVEQETTRIWASDGVLYFNLSKSETVRIYNLSGSLIRTLAVPAGESQETLPRGLYIVKTATKTVKIRH
jgi:autotransporter-associated beta strand protein